MVDGEHPARCRFVTDRVGVLSGGHFAGLCQRLQIEDRQNVGLPVGNEALVEVVGNGDAVHAVQVGNLPHDLPRIRIDYFHRGAVGGVETPVDAIQGDVVPAAGAANLDLIDDLITFRGKRRRYEKG